MNFRDRYGATALIAGATEGMGAAFAHALAAEKMDLILIARRPDLLESFARSLRTLYQVMVLPICIDLSLPDAMEKIRTGIGDRQVNFLVYNAAQSYIGPYLSNPVTRHLQMAETNMIMPMKMLHHFGGEMIKNKKGGVVLMSSIAGNQGSGYLATYAATKAFNRILAESLWYEWRTKGVDVIGCCAGATWTPNYIHSNPKKVSFLEPKPQKPEDVVKECLERIGRVPSFISGRSYKIASFLMNHIFSVKKSVTIMGNTTKAMYSVID